jgi:hypothetical protein
MARADFVTGIVLIALGIATVIASLEMPRFAELNVEPYTAPGLVPGALGAVILVLGGALFVRAARAGGWRLRARTPAPTWAPARGTRNLAIAVALCLGYAGGLIGRVPFWLATFLFVAAFVALFEWRLAGTRAEQARRLAFALAFAAAVAAAVTLVFQEVFLVRLP